MPNKNALNDSRLFEFEWFVSQAGYVTQTATATSPEKISRKFILSTDGERYWDEIMPRRKAKEKKYNPFKDAPGMAKEFSKLPVCRDAEIVDPVSAIKFANRYGLLGTDFLNGREPEKLKDWYDLVILFDEIYGLVQMGLPQHAPLLFNHFGPSPKFKLSLCNAKLKRQRFLEIRPATLLGAMWIMLANDIGRGCDLQACKNPGCGIWFPKKSNKLFCHSNCKMAWRRKQ